MESTSIYAALAAVQSELKAPKGQMNTFGGYRYRSCEDILEAVKPILKAHNLLLTLSDEPKVLEGWHYIEATAKLESLDGGCISVKAYAREPEQKTKMDAAQVTGTSSSYARKYALNGLFCMHAGSSIFTLKANVCTVKMGCAALTGDSVLWPITVKPLPTLPHRPSPHSGEVDHVRSKAHHCRPAGMAQDLPADRRRAGSYRRGFPHCRTGRGCNRLFC